MWCFLHVYRDHGVISLRAYSILFKQGKHCAVNKLIRTLIMSGGLYHCILQVCIGICGGEGAIIQLCALHAERWSHIKGKDFPLRVLSLSSSFSVQQFDGQLKPKLWLTDADLWVITHDRGSLGSGSLCQKSTEEGLVCMCVWGGTIGKNRLTVPPTTPHNFAVSPDCLRTLNDVYITKERWCECSDDIQSQM